MINQDPMSLVLLKGEVQDLQAKLVKSQDVACHLTFITIINLTKSLERSRRSLKIRIVDLKNES